MRNSNCLVLVGAVALGLACPIAKADDTNTYFTTSTPLITTTTENGVLLEKTTTKNGMVIEKSVTSPAVIERTNAAPLIIEDRIVKQKHMFKLGIWPLFDAEIL